MALKKEDKAKLSNITVAILAGGFGTRLQSKMADKPKALAEIRRRPFLAYLLDQISSAGLKEVVICTGYLGEQVKLMFGNSYAGTNLTYSKELLPLGTAGALLLGMRLFRSDPILVMNGDSFCDMNLQAFYTWHKNRDAEASLLLVEVADTSRYGRVRTNAEGRILSFEEKSNYVGSGWINAGIYFINHRLLRTIPPNRFVSLEKEMFLSWINQGLYGYRCKGRFLDIGIPETLAEAEEFFAP